ncbi:beta-N-acetylhexosaminidase [Paenibacillus sp. L3-i20]|uniref:beta-N-acetylhexosaminidase n=1 Tax=Paenibacillus sp. L3-i20 TaxID=2905833 RepID=UPI001EE05637|nr:beta-N-acetylhexosaminidase [Paenibacillus sp. L3-i20]GKU79948.1 glycoside hydrolase family 3 [Paenibacillus sp. L3-i20]
MRREVSLIIVILLTLFVVTSCSKASEQLDSQEDQFVTNTNHITTPPTSEAPFTKTTPAPEAPNNDNIQLQLDSMTLEEKVGQLVIVGLNGTTMQPATKAMINKYKVGGFILFKDNIKNSDQTIKLLNELKKTNKSNVSPLWLSVDQEGGRVRRLPNEFVKTPSAGAIGDVNDSTYTYSIGQALGMKLHALGFNMNFAPVLDINSNPKNPVIGDRAFGTDPQSVTTHGIEMMKGISSQNIAAVVKHFPGHGDTVVDSHFDLPIVSKSLKELEQFELLPFVKAIEEKTDAIMIAHLLMLKLDDRNPATISKEVITGLLREKLNYEGVIITDDMTMAGLMKTNSIGEASVKSILAGSDLILVGHKDELQQEALVALQTSVRSGEISEERLNESVYRLLKLKGKYKISNNLNEAIQLKPINTFIKSVLDTNK